MKLTIEIALIAIVFFSVRLYTQRDLIQGTAPQLEGQLLDGRRVSLQSFKGQAVLLHFWATWCPVCNLEQQSIESVSKQYKTISVAMNSGTANEVREFMKNQQLTFPVIVDENGDIAKQFAVTAVPTSYFIDDTGHIVSIEVGYTSAWGFLLRLWWASN